MVRVKVLKEKTGVILMYFDSIDNSDRYNANDQILKSLAEACWLSDQRKIKEL